MAAAQPGLAHLPAAVLDLALGAVLFAQLPAPRVGTWGIPIPGFCPGLLVHVPVHQVPVVIGKALSIIG